MKMKIIKDVQIANVLAQRVYDDRESAACLSENLLEKGQYSSEEICINFDVSELVKKIRSLADKCYPDGPFLGVRAKGHKGDALLDEGIIRLLSEYEIADEIGFRPEFWNSFQLYYLADIVYYYRHPPVPAKDPKFNFKNLVSGDTRENYMARLWLRLALTRKESGEYDVEMAVKGSSEVWRSHVLRQKSVWGNKLVRAFIDFQYPEGLPERLFEGANKNDVCDGIRLFIKHLAASTSVKCLDIMDETQIIQHMKDLSEELDIRHSQGWNEYFSK